MDFFNVILNKDAISTLTVGQQIFGVLLILIFCIGLVATIKMIVNIFKPSTTTKNQAGEIAANNAPTGSISATSMASEATDELTEEIIAVITAAIAASLETHTSNIVVKNIRRVGQLTPAWSTAGRSEQLNSRF